MKRIGKEVLLLATSEANPRNGEGAFLRLKDGGIIYAYTKYFGGRGGDHDEAYIAAVYSYDEGESWSEDRVLYAKPDGAMNVMSVSLLRMGNGDLGLIYLKKELRDECVLCYPVLHRSVDEGKSFDEGVTMIAEPSYYVLNNDRVIRLSNGRIIFAVANHGRVGISSVGKGVVEVHVSDDDGRSFRKVSGSDLKSPFNSADSGLMEPGLMELPDGRIWLYIRTGYGYQYQSFSADGGESWSAAEPNYKLTSPASPMLAKTVEGYTLTVLNPMPVSSVFTVKKQWWERALDRTPLVCAVGLDGGLSLVDGDFSKRGEGILPFAGKCYYLEDDLNESYCYPSLYGVKGGFLAAYYFSHGSGSNLDSARIIKVRFDELT